MVGMDMSAQKAEAIWDQREVLQSIKDHILKLEVEQTTDEVMKLPRNEDLASRIEAAYSRLATKEAELAQMQNDYDAWLRENR